MKLHICSKKDIDNYCINYRCSPRIRSIYETYDSEDLFVVSLEAVTFEDLINYISKKYRVRLLNFKLSESVDAAISLLVNPYFEELCKYVEANINYMERKFLRFLKKEIFAFFITTTYGMFNDWMTDNGLENEVNNKNVVQRSKEIIGLIDSNIS